MTRRFAPAASRAFCAAAFVVMLVLAAACGGADSGPPPAVTIEPLTTSTPEPRTPPSGIAVGGKRAEPTATAVPVPTATEPAPPPDEPAQIPATAAPSETAVPPTSISAPNSGRWIDVDVTDFSVRLMDGGSVVQEIAPVGVGVAIDTGDYISTQTGMFYVHTKSEALVYDPPFDTYISHWVGFDADKDNGFHSFLKDADGAVVDSSTGRVSNGCIRTGAPDAIFAYADIGMPVWVHW